MIVDLATASDIAGGLRYAGAQNGLRTVALAAAGSSARQRRPRDGESSPGASGSTGTSIAPPPAYPKRRSMNRLSDAFEEAQRVEANLNNSELGLGRSGIF